MVPVFLASVIPAFCLIGVCQSGCDKTSVVACMIVATLFYGAMFSGVFANHVDIASNFAGTTKNKEYLGSMKSTFTMFPTISIAKMYL